MLYCERLRDVLRLTSLNVHLQYFVLVHTNHRCGCRYSSPLTLARANIPIRGPLLPHIRVVGHLVVRTRTLSALRIPSRKQLFCPFPALREQTSCFVHGARENSCFVFSWWNTAGAGRFSPEFLEGIFRVRKAEYKTAVFFFAAVSTFRGVVRLSE